jgi:hypothetical protein
MPTIPEPEPTQPVPAPSPTPESTAPRDNDESREAQTTSDEEATIKAQIESFVSQNNQTAPGTTPAAPSAPTPEKQAESPAAADDAMMASAVKDLVSGTDSKETIQSPASTAPSVVSPSNTGTTAPTPANADTSTEEEDSSSVMHKKIISPISGAEKGPQPAGLDELLAKEGISGLDEESHPFAPPTTTQPNGMTTAPHPPGHVISPNSNQNGVDPNSIAL